MFNEDEFNLKNEEKSKETTDGVAPDEYGSAVNCNSQEQVKPQSEFTQAPANAVPYGVNRTFPNSSYHYAPPQTYSDGRYYSGNYSPAPQPFSQSAEGSAKKQSKKKKFGKGKLIALVAVCLVISCAAGAVCGYFSNSLFKSAASGKNGEKENSGGSNVVIYQSPEGSSESLTLETGYTVSEVAKIVAPYVVEIRTESVTSNTFLGQYVTSGAGSGVIISEDGYIVTNNHVIEDATTINVTLSDGKSYEATLVGTDQIGDIAVIKIEATGLSPAVFGESGSLSVGDYAMVVGNPLGQLGGTVTDGIISALARNVTIDGTDMTLLQTSAAINPGNSGGGLFDSSGKLIGIVNAKAAGSEIEGLGFAIPIDTAKPIIESIIEHGYVTGRVRAGITILDVLDYATAFQYRVTQLGPYVYAVEPGSDAEKAGIKAGDLIMSVDDTLVYQGSYISNYFANCKVGDTVSVTVNRNGEELVLKMTFTEYIPTK